MIGQTVLHYRILGKLGEGGMGVVYKARDTKLERDVALKFLPPRLHASAHDRARFLREAKAAAALNHPNICSVIDVQETDGPGERQMFIVMEFVEGRSLKEFVGSTRESAVTGSSQQTKRAMDIGIQVADALAAAHEKGIVHRDIKPENIMVRKDGIVQIMDFGLAQLSSAAGPRLTEVGSTVGTAGYMSPEQLQGQEVDHRSDIFSLGVLLYELFSGQRPFKGVHNAALAYEIVNVNPPPPSSAVPGIDPEVDRIVMECLQKDRVERCQSCAEVAKDLRRVKRSTEGAGGRASVSQAGVPLEQGAGRRSIRVPVGAATMFIALAVVAAAAALVFWRPWAANGTATEPVERFVVSLPPRSVLELERDGLALSPDGRQLAFIARQDTTLQLFLRDMASFDARPVTAAAGLNMRNPFFSPDARWLGLFANGKLMKLSLSGGAPVTICDDFWGQASWGDGGNIVFVPAWGSPLWIVSSDPGSTAHQLTQLNTDAGERAHLLPCVLPGGKQALFTIWRGGAFADDLVAVVDLKTGAHRIVLAGGTGAFYLPAGYLLFLRGSTVMAAPFDLGQVKITGDPFPVLDHVLVNGSDGYPYLAVSNSGTLAYAPGDVEFVPTSLNIVTRGIKDRLLESPGKNLCYPNFSPDGRRMAVVITGPTFQIGVYDLQRNTLTPLTFSADNFGSAWTPDGTHITFISNKDGRYQVYTIPADGSGTPERLFNQETPPPPPPHAFSWSRDGMHLAYVSITKATGMDIWLYSRADSPSVRPLIATPANESNPSFSPDGRWLAYASDESGEGEVYVQPFPPTGGRWRVSQSGGGDPAWSPDGRRLLFQRSDEIFSVELRQSGGGSSRSLVVGGEERVLARPDLLSFDLAHDGKTFAIGRSNPAAAVDHFNLVVGWGSELREHRALAESGRAAGD